jgi:hypothetical protein
MHISKLLVNLHEQGGLPINYAPGEKEQVAANQARPGGATPAAGPAPAQAVSNQIKISGPGGVNYIVGYVNASKAWAVYKQEAGSAKATVMPGPPLQSLAAAFAQVAAYF